MIQLNSVLSILKFKIVTNLNYLYYLRNYKVYPSDQIYLVNQNSPRVIIIYSFVKPL